MDAMTGSNGSSSTEHPMATRKENSNFIVSWHFVNPSDAESRRQSRIHAMRESSRKQKWLQEQERSTASVVKSTPLIWQRADDDSYDQTTGESTRSDEGDSTLDSKSKTKRTSQVLRTFKSRPSSTRGSPQPKSGPRQPSESFLALSHIDPKSILGAGRTDPFAAFPVSNLNNHVDSLADFYLAIFGSSLLGIPADAKYHPPRDFYLVPLMQDPAAFHSLMAYVGCMRDEMFGRVPGPEALSHKLEAIKLVNERLSCGRFDDYSISAINLLWTQEGRLDNKQSAQAHLDGLQQLIVRRGGTVALPPTIQVALAWSITTVPGRFTLPFTKSPEDQVRYNPAVNEIALITFLRSIQALTQHPNSPYPLHSPFFTPELPLYRLLSSTQEPPAHFIIRLTSRFRMRATCRLAALLCIHSIYLDYPDSFRELSRHLINLSSRILEHEMHRRGTVEFLFSTLMVSEAGEMKIHDRAWEMVRMVSAVKSLSLEVLIEANDLLFECLTTGVGSQSSSGFDNGSGRTCEATKEMGFLRLELLWKRIRNEFGKHGSLDNSGLSDEAVEER